MVVLDTHAWLWWVDDPRRLSAPARAALAAADAVGVVAISCWEVAMLAARDRIELDRDPRRWVRAALAQPGIFSLDVGPQVATDAALLDDGFPGDPADRLIYSAARASGAALVTKDARLREYDARGTIW